VSLHLALGNPTTSLYNPTFARMKQNQVLSITVLTERVENMCVYYTFVTSHILEPVSVQPSYNIVYMLLVESVAARDVCCLVATASEAEIETHFSCLSRVLSPDNLHNISD
jgi:hypothetical protein